ncbi:hypothetical protein KAX02_09095 [candidate division WOR-3 bacterium]|nr:hypothetical protein [candidate division WOR-3 bacterium]
MRIKLLYGNEFWETFNELIKNVKERVFIASAYLGKTDYVNYKNLIPSNVFWYFACRSDNNFKPKDRCVLIDKNYFHGKIYLIDNCIILGSQNLYTPQIVRQGEFSVLFETDKFTSSLILYQALLKIAKQLPIIEEPVNEAFLNFYIKGCPFCNNDIAEPFSIITCPEYGGGFVSEEDCSSYGGTGACKYCIAENRESLGECYCCDHSGCGFGISIDKLSFIYHTFDPPDRIREERAREFVRTFNFLAKYMKKSEDAVDFFYSLGFIGKIYNARIETFEWQIK